MLAADKGSRHDIQDVITLTGVPVTVAVSARLGPFAWPPTAKYVAQNWVRVSKCEERI